MQPAHPSDLSTSMARGLITAEELRLLISYDSETGSMTWNRRLRESLCCSRFKTPGSLVRWNNRYAGKEAGSVRTTTGYLTVMIWKKHYSAHRLAWLYVTGNWPTHEIDHINGNRADNRFSNLRAATTAENQQNRARPITNTSGFIGVHQRRDGFGYESKIVINRVVYRLGTFKTKEAAFAAYVEAKKKLHAFQPTPREMEERYASK